MLLSQERERIEMDEAACLVAIAEAWAERKIRVGLACYTQVHSLTAMLATELQVAVRNLQLNVYDTHRKKERPYRREDEESLEKGSIRLLPRSVDVWLEANGFMPTLATPSIVTPEEWKQSGPCGVQRADDTDAGRLVRLADLVRWLMSSRELPCKSAVELVCAVLEDHPSAAGKWTYLLSESGYAMPLPWDHSFFYLPIVAASEPILEGEAADKGVLGIVKFMREYWAESSAPGAGNWCGQHVLEPLAIRLEIAHWLWGYGSRITKGAGPLDAASTTKVSVTFQGGTGKQMEGVQAALPKMFVQVSALQDAEILDAIRAGGYDPKSVPKNPPGKSGIKAKIRSELVGKFKYFPKKGGQFDKAWDRLRSRGDIADAKP